jgi:hypothetical protein
MNTFILALISFILCLNLIVFIAIWRAILGKSSIDYKLADSITSNVKALENNSAKYREMQSSMDRLLNSNEMLKQVISGLPNSMNEKIQKEVNDLLKTKNDGFGEPH